MCPSRVCLNESPKATFQLVFTRLWVGRIPCHTLRSCIEEELSVLSYMGWIPVQGVLPNVIISEF